MKANTVEERLREFCNRCEVNCCERDSFSSLYLCIAPEIARGEVLETKKCYYLKDGRCSNYDSRPPACRFYPFSNGRKGPFLDESCPAVSGNDESPPIPMEEFCNSSLADEAIKAFDNYFHDRCL